MKIKHLSEVILKGEFDPLSMYHHATAFDAKLAHLLEILAAPKEYNLADRFKKLESTLDASFRLEIIHHLHLKVSGSPVLQDESDHHHHPHPQILLHLWCLLECTDSLSYIARYLELDIAEVQELIRELHHSFSIESLVSRIRQYCAQNRYLRESALRQKRSELLGVEPILEPKDTNEDRKQRLRRRYGHLSKVFDAMTGTF